MKKSSLVLTLLFLSIAFISCSGSNGSDGKDAPPQEEEDTGGTSGGGGGGSACLSTNQKENITKLFNRLADISQASGLAKQSSRDSEGNTINTDLFGGYIFTKESDSSWTVYGAFCDELEQCYEISSKASFRNGCFFVDKDQAKILSSSSNSLRVYVKTVDGSRDESSISISSSDKVRTQEIVSQGGVTYYVFDFKED
jgi:hypothetical protein